MTDLYLKADTEAEMNAALIDAGMAYEDEGVLYPANDVSLDVIGPITKWDNSVDPPVEIIYPEWHVNVRIYDLDEEKEAIIAPFLIVPPEVPYRVWA